jgi:hypothetical protein
LPQLQAGVVLANEEIADLILEDVEGEIDLRVSTYIARDKADGKGY